MPQDIEMESVCDEAASMGLTDPPNEDRRPLLTLPLRQGTFFLEVEQTLNGEPLPSLFLNTRGELAKKILARVADGELQLRQLDWGREQPQVRLTKVTTRAGDQALLLAQCAASAAATTCSNCERNPWFLTCAVLPPGLRDSTTACVCCVLRRTTDTCEHNTVVTKHEGRKLRGLEASRKDAVRASQQLLRPFGLQVADAKSRALPSLELDDSDKERIMQRRLRKLGLVAVGEKELQALRDVREIHPKSDDGDAREYTPMSPVFGSPPPGDPAGSPSADSFALSSPADADVSATFAEEFNFSPLQRLSPGVTGAFPVLPLRGSDARRASAVASPLVRPGEPSSPPSDVEMAPAPSTAPGSALGLSSDLDAEAAAAAAQLQAKCTAAEPLSDSEVNTSSAPALSTAFSAPAARILDLQAAGGSSSLLTGLTTPMDLDLDTPPTEITRPSTGLPATKDLEALTDRPGSPAAQQSADEALESLSSASTGSDVGEVVSVQDDFDPLPVTAREAGDGRTIQVVLYPFPLDESAAGRSNLRVVALNDGGFWMSGDEPPRAWAALLELVAQGDWMSASREGRACGRTVVGAEVPVPEPRRNIAALPPSPAVTGPDETSAVPTEVDSTALTQSLEAVTLGEAGGRDDDDDDVPVPPFGKLSLLPY
ncbi:hypothetical protein KEM52_006524 [Ascosphaera acerosa]|nr:hypothetical protein KEM52_006524 [Ascosphaera acerosa]